MSLLFSLYLNCGIVQSVQAGMAPKEANCLCTKSRQQVCQKLWLSIFKKLALDTTTHHKISINVDETGLTIAQKPVKVIAKVSKWAESIPTNGAHLKQLSAR